MKPKEIVSGLERLHKRFHVLGQGPYLDSLDGSTDSDDWLIVYQSVYIHKTPIAVKTLKGFRYVEGFGIDVSDPVPSEYIGLEEDVIVDENVETYTCPYKTMQQAFMLIMKRQVEIEVFTFSLTGELEEAS